MDLDDIFGNTRHQRHDQHWHGPRRHDEQHHDDDLDEERHGDCGDRDDRDHHGDSRRWSGRHERGDSESFDLEHLAHQALANKKVLVLLASPLWSFSCLRPSSCCLYWDRPSTTSTRAG